MKSLTIEIIKLGPIRNSKIEVRPLTVFTKEMTKLE